MNAQAVQERSLNLKKVLIDDSKIARLVLRKHGAEKYGKLWLEKTRNRIEESSEDSEESDTDTEGKFRVVMYLVRCVDFELFGARLGQNFYKTFLR